MKNFSYSSVLCVSLLSISFGAFSAEGLNVDLVILKINKEVKSLNKDILSLKDEIEVLRENQRLNSEKIDELLQMIELNQTNNKTSEKSIETKLIRLPILEEISPVSKLSDKFKPGVNAVPRNDEVIPPLKLIRFKSSAGISPIS